MKCQEFWVFLLWTADESAAVSVRSSGHEHCFSGPFITVYRSDTFKRETFTCPFVATWFLWSLEWFGVLIILCSAALLEKLLTTISLLKFQISLKVSMKSKLTVNLFSFLLRLWSFLFRLTRSRIFLPLFFKHKSNLTFLAHWISCFIKKYFTLFEVTWIAFVVSFSLGPDVHCMGSTISAVILT